MSRRNRSTMVFEDEDETENSRPSRRSVEKGNSSAITGVMRISLSKLNEAITQLAQVSNKKLEELTDLESSLLGSVMNAIRNRNSNTNNIMSKISQEFAEKKPLLPGTVGSQLAGCVHNDSFMIPECSAVCAGSASPNTVGMSECMYNVIHYRDDGSIVLYHKNSTSDHAILHVLSNNFKGITQEQLKSIQEDGIKYVNINKPGSDFDVSSGFLPLSKVPIVSSSEATRESAPAAPQTISPNQRKHSPPPPNTTPQYSTTWNAFTIVGVILLIVLALLLIWFIFSSSRKQKDHHHDHKESAMSFDSIPKSEYSTRSSLAEALL